MSIETASTTIIGSPAYLKGTTEVPVTINRLAVAIPQELAAHLSHVTGAALTSLPGKVAVSSLSGLGWAAFGTLHRLMWATRFIFTGAKTEKAVHEAAWTIDLIGQQELMAKESLRNSSLGIVNKAASIIPGGFLIQGATATVSAIDATSKQTQRWGLFGLRLFITNVFDFAKFVLSGTLFRWGERKVEHIKNSFYSRMLHPSPLGENILLWSDERHATALKLLSPIKTRPPIAACSEEEFERFIETSPDAKRIILDKVICSKIWGLSFDEASIFRTVLERWIKNEEEHLLQSEEDKKVLINLYAIYKTLPAARPFRELTSEEIAPFLELPLDKQCDTLFLLSYCNDNPQDIPSYLSSLLHQSKEITEKYLFRSRITQLNEEFCSLRQEIMLPSEFEKLSSSVQYRIFKLVSRECFLSSSEQNLFLQKAPNRSSWKSISPEDKRLLSHICLYYFNRLSREKQLCIYDISLGDIKKLPEEQLHSFLCEILEKIPPTGISTLISQNVEQITNPHKISEEIDEEEFLDTLFQKGTVWLTAHPENLRRFILIANKRIPFEKKILLRDSLDTPLAIYFFSEAELKASIEKFKLLAHDLALPEDQRLVSLKILKVLRKALEWHITEIAEKEELQSSDTKVREALPPRKVDLPETPLAEINSKIGSQIVSTGSIYRSLDIFGTVLEKSITLGSLTIGQVPRGIGVALDSTIGSTAVYGVIRSVAIALQVCSQFQVLMNYLAQSLKITVSGKEYTWIDSVERPAASIPLIPLKLAVTLQDTFVGGMEKIKGRFDSWNENIASLKRSQTVVEQASSPKELQERILQAEGARTTTAAETVKAVKMSGEPRIKALCQLPDAKLTEIFSLSKDLQDTTIQIRNAAFPSGLRALPSELTPEFSAHPQEPAFSPASFTTITPSFLGPRGGTRIDLRPTPPAVSIKKPSFVPVISEHGVTPSATNLEPTEVTGAIQSNPMMHNLTQTVFQKTSELTALYQNLQVAQTAQQTINDASSLQKLFVQYGGDRLSSLYTSKISPSLEYGLTLWKKEAEYTSTVVDAISSIEALQTKAMYSLFSGVERSGNVAQASGDTAMKWLSEHVSDLLVEHKSEEAKSAARKKIDDALGYLAGFSSRSIVTYYLYSFLGFHSPVIILPFLLSRTIPELLNRVSEPIAKNLGKRVFINGYHGIAWAGKAGGQYTHEGMSAIGKFVQAAINRRQGYVDEERTRAFCCLCEADQKYVFELVKQSTQIDEHMHNELNMIGALYFDSPASLDSSKKTALIEALLIVYDHLQPQDFLKITPAYFYHLDECTQKRVKHFVKQKFPREPISKPEQVVAKFNELSKEDRKAINNVTREEFFALSLEKQYEFCFQVLHSAAFKEWYNTRYYDEPSFSALWKFLDPKKPAIPLHFLDILLGFYQEVGDGEFANLSPNKLSQFPLSRLIRLYEFLERSHQEELGLIADALDIEEDSIRTILEIENSQDPVLNEQRCRLLAAMTIAFRSLRPYSQKLFQDISQLQISYMSKEEKKMYLDFLLQKCPEQKQALTPILLDAELQNATHIETFISLFNSLKEEDKLAAHQAVALHKETFSYLTRALIEELKNIDTQLQKVSLEKIESEQGIISCTHLLNAIKEAEGSFDTKKRVQILSEQIQTASSVKEKKEKELSFLLAARKEIETLLQDEHISIPSCPVQQPKQNNPLIETICDLTIKAMTDALLTAKTHVELEEKYTSSKKDLFTMIQKLHADSSLDAQGKDFLSLLEKRTTALESAYEEQKHRLDGTICPLPHHLEIIVRGIKERFMTISNVVTLKKSYTEAITLVKQLAQLVEDSSPNKEEIALRQIDALFTLREKELHTEEEKRPHDSSWETVKSLLPFLTRTYAS